MDTNGKYIVFACAKNENDYILEWINHYLNLGFDEIVIADNNNDYSLREVISDYIDNGTVEIMDFVNKPLYQVHEYSKFCEKGEYEWCAYFDCDEFLELNGYDNIKEYLSNVDYDCVSFNWIMYGSNGQIYKTEGGVQERFKLPFMPLTYMKENCFIKSIVRGGKLFTNCYFNGSHLPRTSNPNIRYSFGGYTTRDAAKLSHQIFPPRYKQGYIKHYYTKSYNEWISKTKRGWPDGTPTLNSANYFLLNEKYTVPVEKFTDIALFIQHQNESGEVSNEALTNYNVCICQNTNGWYYPFIHGVFDLLKKSQGHVYILNGESVEISEELFAMFLEYSFITGNRLIYAKDYNEAAFFALKYSTNPDKSYYILDLM